MLKNKIKKSSLIIPNEDYIVLLWKHKFPIYIIASKTGVNILTVQRILRKYKFDISKDYTRIPDNDFIANALKQLIFIYLTSPKSSNNIIEHCSQQGFTIIKTRQAIKELVEDQIITRLTNKDRLYARK